MRTTAGERRARAKRNLIFLGLFLILAVGAYFAYQYYEQHTAVQERGVATEGFGERRRVEYRGRKYAEKTALTTILVMGVDREDSDARVGARSGGQADFLLLLAVDHQHKRIYQLQIDRDTLTPVAVMGILGNKVGTRTTQICLAHGFGMTEEECCLNTVEAASNLLEGLEIDYYVSISMSAMAKVNNLLGGVTVTMDKDYTDIDPVMTEGATIRLTDEQAGGFLRGRMNVGEGTNADRMSRHRLFLHAAADRITEMTKASAGFIADFYTGLQDSMSTNMTQSALVAEVNEAIGYEVVPIETLPGEHMIGSDGFMEFHVENGAPAAWVMSACYDPVD